MSKVKFPSRPLKCFNARTSILHFLAKAVKDSSYGGEILPDLVLSGNGATAVPPVDELWCEVAV